MLCLYFIRVLERNREKKRVFDNQKNHTVYSVYVRKKINRKMEKTGKTGKLLFIRV